MSETSASRPGSAGDATPAGRRALPPAASPARIAVAIVLAVLIAAAGNIVVSLVVGLIEGQGGDPSFAVLLTVAGVLAGALGWALIRTLASNPAAVLRVLVPVVVIVSFLPDLWLLTQGFSAVLVVGLMVMHVVVAVPTVLAMRRVLPV